jgi:iron transport multicopper oxidase
MIADVPTLYTVLTAPAANLNTASIYGWAANPYIIPYKAIVEMTITNHDTRAHPFHLHGHTFQITSRYSNSALFPSLEVTPKMPLMRDTLVVYANSAATIRFVADNPGINLFHCHTEWHVIAGMSATFIEAPEEIVARKPYIPTSHRAVCDDYGILRKGNAAGNSKNYLDLTGANTVAPMENWGALIV